MEGNLILQEAVVGGSCPSMEVVRLPFPFHHVGDGRCHVSPYSIPLVLLVVELVMNGLPGLFNMRLLFLRPGVKELVHGFDVMDEDLICWIHVSVSMEVVCAVKESSSVVSHGLVVSRG